MAEEKQMQQPEAPATPATAQVRDKRTLPEGVVPKQAQGYVVAGLALLILMAVLFSKNHARPVPKATAAATSTAMSNDMNQQRIHELEQDLSTDQRQSEQQQAQTQKVGTMASPGNATATNTAEDGGAPAAQPLQQTRPPRDPIADAEKALAFKARFASNLVGPAGAATPAATGINSAAASSGQTNALSVNHPATLPQPDSATQSQSATAGSKHGPEVNIDAAHGRPYVIFEGTTIDTVLTNRLDSDFAGPVTVMVTNPVYSRDRQHVLIPAGTFILGDTQKIGSMGQRRLAVTFHRMIMPDGYGVDLDQFHGLDQIGDTGLKDKVNHHYLQIFGASIALGVIAGATESTTYGGYTESGSDMYRQGMASSLSQSSADVLDRFINIPPTITIREGHRIKVYITQDMLLPAYENHDMPGVM
ncbi:MAG: TrbI/VirB10 family protein [Acidobacteriaceae bacterium]